MKKQTEPNIKAHLLRGAFYLLLLVAVCVIPFALGQSRSRGTAKRSVPASATRADRALTFADRLARSFYAHDQRLHGELKRRAEADLQAQLLPARLLANTFGVVSSPAVVPPLRDDHWAAEARDTVEQMKQTSGTFSETELV